MLKMREFHIFKQLSSFNCSETSGSPVFHSLIKTETVVCIYADEVGTIEVFVSHRTQLYLFLTATRSGGVLLLPLLGDFAAGLGALQLLTASY